MAWADRGPMALPTIDQTLKRVVLLMRMLGWVWLMIHVPVALADQSADTNSSVLLGAALGGTLGAVLMFVAFQRDFLGSGWYVALDGMLNLGLVSAGWLGDYREFITGGYPMSWLFVVAYASNLIWTVVAGIGASIVFAFLHQLMDLDTFRVIGSVQFIVVAAVVGWAFEALRQRERMRLQAEERRNRAEDDRADAQRVLAIEREQRARLEERTDLARRLHDSVLQTLKLISAEAEDPAEVRYLARVQERDLRRTISEYQSPHEESFRADLANAIVDARRRHERELSEASGQVLDRVPRLLRAPVKRVLGL